MPGSDLNDVNFAATDGPRVVISADNWTTFTTESNVFVPEESFITIYVFGFNAVAVDKTLSVDNMQVNCAVVVPEPTSFALIAAALFTGVLLVRRR